MSHLQKKIQWVDVVSWTIGLVVLLNLTMYFGYKVHGTWTATRAEHRREAKVKKKKALWNGLAIFTVALMYTLVIFSWVLYFFVPPLSCRLPIRIAACFWHFGKMIKYTVFICRVDSVYSNTMHAYKKWVLNALLTFCWTGGIVLAGITLITANPKDERTSAGVKFCERGYPKHVWAVGLVLILDGIICISTLWMFTKPLKSIANQLQSDDSISSSVKSRIRDLNSLAIRYTVATWTAVLSTFLMMVFFSMSDSTMLSPVDFTIDCVCLGLLTNWYPQYFERMCAFPLWLSRCCFSCDLETGIERKKMGPLSKRDTDEAAVTT